MKKPMKTMNFLRFGSVVAALLALAVLPACENTSVDTSGLDSYFANNPYVSDPRTGPGSDVFINPSSAIVSFVGQDLLFTASGGTPPYSWNVSIAANGNIVGRDNQCDYRATTTNNNDVIVYDVNGHSAIATISASAISSTVTPGTTLAISPPTATILAGNSVPFTAVGGDGTYHWHVANSLIISSAQDGIGVTFTYTANTNAAPGTVNTVTLTDGSGASTMANVTHI